MMKPDGAHDKRMLILAPGGRDADVIGRVLARNGFPGSVVAGFEDMVGELDAGAGACVIAEEALQDASVLQLLAWLRAQPPWSDFPFVVLISKRPGAGARTARSIFDQLGNVVLLERPLNTETLCSAAASALRGRRRQYQARKFLAEREAAAENLRESQAQLLQLNQTLESRIEERTRALAQANDRLMNEVLERERVQQALVQLQKMEAIGRLTGGMAHDFNNLLNVIQGSMDLLLHQTVDENVRRKAEAARRACERGAKLTGQLLAFSRNQRLDLRAVDVRTMLDGVRELMATSLGASVALQLDLREPLGHVLADRNQMEMALLNLAINARDAMPDGGLLRISARRAEAPDGLLQEGSYCVIAVTDNGQGIEPAVIGKVFEPFFTTKGVGKGTGLGLSQVYGMAQQSGGTARVSSERGVGTTVEIWLRQAEEEQEPAAQAAPAPSLDGAGQQVLVVEDDSPVRQLMVESLEALGYQVSQAADGEAGLRELRRARPSLMITDYLMPGMTGAELVSIANREFPGLPVIIATGYADMQAIEQVIGANTVLRKPFQLGELAAVVSEALARPAASTPA